MEKFELCGDVPDPDRRLITWQKWVQDRNRECKGLAKKLDRTPADLVMNLVDKFREKKEREYLLEEAQADEKLKSKDRLWKQKPRTQNSEAEASDVLLSAPNALSTNSAAPYVFEHVGVPFYIQTTEKGVMGKLHRRRRDGHEYDDYFRRREEQLSEKIKKIDPYRPSIDNLYVKGEKPKVETSSPSMPPTIVVEPAVEPPEHELSAVHAVRINDTVICKDVPGQSLTYLNDLKTHYEPCTSWSYYFHVPAKRIGRSKLFMQNLGTVTLRYCWKKEKKSVLSIPQDRFGQVFFFNKNEDLLFPGQSREIVFSFLSDKPGMFSECWNLSLRNISFFDTAYEKLVVNFHADAVEDIDADNEKVRALQSDIDRLCRSRMVQMIIYDIVDRATASEPEVSPYERMFLEREIFVMKNPFCFYHQSQVERLKEAFAEMVEGEEWDLSIHRWTRAMMAESLENRMRFYGILKESYRDLLTLWHEGDEVADEKIRIVKMFLRQSFHEFDERFVTLLHTAGVDLGGESPAQVVFAKLKSENPSQALKIHSTFYMSMRDQLCDAVETIAGIVRSLDSYRMTNFEICSC